MTVVGAAAVAYEGACAVVDDGDEVFVDGSSAPCSYLCASQAWDHLFFHGLYLDHGPFLSLHQVPSYFWNMEVQGEAEYEVYPWVLVAPHA